jgi:hypothetical protein
VTVSDDYSSQAIENLVDRIRGDDHQAQDNELTTRDREALLEFHNRLQRHKMASGRAGDHHHSTQLSLLFSIARETQQLAVTLDDPDEGGRDAVDDVLSWVTGQDYSGFTVQSSLSALRMFAAHMLDCDLTEPGDDNLDEQLPRRFAEISPSEHVDVDPAPLPSNVVRYGNLTEMIEAEDKIRNQAMLATQWGAGLRPMAEFWQLQRRHISDEGDHIKITVPADTKTGRRTVILVVGAPLLRQWIEDEHPVHLPGEGGMSPDTYIWTHHNENTHLGYSALSTVFENAGGRIALEKDHSPQHIRRSSASVMAERPHISERDLRKRFGWSRYSEAPEHYIGAMTDGTEVNVARAYGHDIEELDEPVPVAPIRCAACDQWTTRGLDACIWCSHDIDDDLGELEHTVKHPLGPDADLLDLIMEGEIDADDLRSLKRLEPVLRSRPDVLDDIDKLIQLAEGYEAEDEDSTSTKVVNGAGSLLAWGTAKASDGVSQFVRAKHLAHKLDPAIEDYPPDRWTAGKILAGWMLIGAISLAVLSNNTMLEAAVNGDPVGIGGALFGLILGVALVISGMPTVDGAVERLAEEA